MFSNSKQPFLPPKPFSKTGQTSQCASAWTTLQLGTRSPLLVGLTLEPWEWCLQKSIVITAQHLAGKLNNVADRESREFYDSSEWQIDPQVIQPFLRRCSVDLFASRLTALFPTYASWKRDPGASYTDAMTLDWSILRGYAFPPFSLIAPVLKKVSQDKADLVLVAPVWQAQPWWSALLNVLIKNPVMIPNSKHPQRDPVSPLRIHPMYPRLYLAVFPYQGTARNRRVFREQYKNTPISNWGLHTQDIPVTLGTMA